MANETEATTNISKTRTSTRGAVSGLGYIDTVPNTYTPGVSMRRGLHLTTQSSYYPSRYNNLDTVLQLQLQLQFDQFELWKRS